MMFFFYAESVPPRPHLPPRLPLPGPLVPPPGPPPGPLVLLPGPSVLPGNLDATTVQRLMSANRCPAKKSGCLIPGPGDALVITT